jgi:hypothetical protein
MTPVLPIPKPSRVVDLTGRRFGRWVVLGYHGRKVYPASKYSVAEYWRVRCDCGTETSVQGRSLTAETSQGCAYCSGFRGRSHNVYYGKSMT